MIEIIGSVVGLALAGICAFIAYRLMKSVVNTKPHHMM